MPPSEIQPDCVSGSEAPPSYPPAIINIADVLQEPTGCRLHPPRTLPPTPVMVKDLTDDPAPAANADLHHQ